MADNVNITEGSGAVIAADEVTRNTILEKQQVIKLSLGVDGAFDTLVDSGQQTSANSLPVVIASDQSTIPISAISLPLPSGAATSANQTSEITQLTTLAGAVSGTEIQVDILTMPSVIVSATDLDIRNLTSADIVTVTGGAGQTADVKITLDSESVAVTGTFWQTTQPVSIASMPTTTVTATDLDIRDLVNATDSVAIYGSDDGGTTKRIIKTDAGGAIQVDLEVTNVTADTELTTADLDTGAGTDTRAVVGLVGSKSGGGELIPGSATDGLLVNLGANNDVTVTSGTITTITNAVTVNAHAVTVASGGIASGAIASGAIASGAMASGAIASGALAAGSIAVGAITAGDTSIATTEDTARAGGEHLVKVGVSRLDTPVANANVSTDGDYTNFIADNFGKLWTSATVPEDTAHVAGEAISVQGSRRIATLATSSGSDADWSTVNQTNEGAAWASLAATATPNGLLVGNFTSGDTYTALTNSAQVIKASAGNLYGYYIYNPNTTATYVMIYNIAAASVTVGTSTAILVFCIPASSAANLTFPVPIPFSNAGWSIAAATTGGGNTAPTTALEAMIFYL